MGFWFTNGNKQKVYVERGRHCSGLVCEYQKPCPSCVDAYTMKKGKLLKGKWDAEDKKIVSPEVIDEVQTRDTYSTRRWTAPELYPAKVAQRLDAIEKTANGGTAVELYAGEGNLTNKLYADKFSFGILVDENAKLLEKAKERLKESEMKVQTHHMDNLDYIKNVLDPNKKITMLDADAFGSPASRLREFFKNYEVKSPMTVTYTDGAQFNAQYMSHRPDERRAWIKKEYGVTNVDAVKKADMPALWEQFWKNVCRENGLRYEVLPFGFGRSHAFYGGVKLYPN